MLEPPTDAPATAERKGCRPWLWILVGAVFSLVSCCGGTFWFIWYVGDRGPLTSVYTGNQVPDRFRATMKEVNAFDDGETLLYFYSDGLVDIKSGFYFVSDQKVAIYGEAIGLTTIAFADIESAELYRDTSFFVDSKITLELTDGTPISFPVSSERNGDQDFFEEIQSRIPSAKEEPRK